MAAASRFLFAACWFVLLLLPLFSMTDVPVFRDHSNYFLPCRFHLATQPGLWWDGNALGVPAYADPQYQFWHPQALLFRLLPFAAAYNAALLLGFAVIFVFAFLLGRHLHDTLTGFFAAVAITGSGAILSLSEFTSYFATFATLFPLAYVVVTAAQSPYRLYWLPPLLYCALTAGGLSFFLLALPALAAAIPHLRRQGVPAARLRTVALLSAALCFLPLFPFAEFFVHSSYAQAPPAQDFRLTAAGLRGLCTPGQQEPPGQSLFPLRYAGITLMLLFVSGLHLRPRTALAAVLVTLFCVYGANALPLNLFRYPEKLFVFAVVLAVAVAAARFARLQPAARALLLVLLAGELLLVNAGHLRAYTMPLPVLTAAATEYPTPAGARVFTVVSTGLQPQFTGTSIADYATEHFRYRYGLAAAFAQQRTFLAYSPAQVAVGERLRALHARRDLPAGALSALLQNCGVGYVYARREVDGQPFAGAPDWRMISPDNRREAPLVFALPRPLPDALLISPDALANMQQPEDALRLHAYTPVPGDIIRNGQASFRCRVDNPAYLVLQTLVYPGMRLFVDGRETPYHTVFGAYPAVAVATGERLIELKRLPTLLPLTLGTFLLGACCLLRALRRP